MSERHPAPSLRAQPFGGPLAFSTAHNGSAQLSYFIYSCTVRTQPHRHTPAKRQHARVNLSPNVLCIRSTMSNSQRTSQRLDALKLILNFVFLERSGNWWSRTGSNR